MLLDTLWKDGVLGQESESGNEKGSYGLVKTCKGGGPPRHPAASCKAQVLLLNVVAALPSSVLAQENDHAIGATLQSIQVESRKSSVHFRLCWLKNFLGWRILNVDSKARRKNVSQA